MASFEVGHNPRVVRCPENIRDFIPAPYKGVLIISADFELAWAWRYAKTLGGRTEAAEEYARIARVNVPEILRLCEEYHIPITWGTVGHLFLEQCQAGEAGLAHTEIDRLAYFENEYWRYTEGDWFGHDPCTSWRENDAWYAPDLVDQILASPVKHEIGCHTFSHIDCSDEHCPPAVIRDELAACQKAANNFDIKLESFIFPGHTMGNFQTIKECGYTSVRVNYANQIGYPVRDEFGLWHLPATAEIIMNPKWGESYNLYRFRRIIKRTLRNQAVANLWFHPSLPSATVVPLFKTIFQYANMHRGQLWVTTMRDYVGWLNRRESAEGVSKASTDQYHERD